MDVMGYDHDLADGIRDLVAGEDGVTEQRMFGGLAFLVHGNLAIAASGQGGLLVRVDPVEAEQWIDGEHVAPMVMRGREMRGWLHVVADAAAPDLEDWVGRGVRFARGLPPKRA